MRHLRLICTAIMAVLPLTYACQAAGQDFPPNKTVTLVAGFAAGGAADAAARLIAKQLGVNLGTKIVVDNKAGGVATSPINTWPTARPMGPCCCSAPLAH